MFEFWLVRRYFSTSKGVLSLSTTLSVIGMVIGVGSLVVAMAVVSGYETTLRKSVIDLTGHLFVMLHGGEESADDFNQLKASMPGVQAYTPFVYLEGVLANAGKLSGVFVEGVDEATVHQVLRIKNRVIDGAFDLSAAGERSRAVIGRGLAKKHSLKVGDPFSVVILVSSRTDQRSFKPRSIKLVVAGILDMGRFDYDNRYIALSMRVAQDFAQIGTRISGYRFRFKNDEEALSASDTIDRDFRDRYSPSNWYDVNRPLFEAIRIEKPVLFFVLLILVVAASFNISSTLFVNVVRRFRDISILKSMGAGRRLILTLFTLQGLVIGAVGAVLGIILGLVACAGFSFAQEKWGLLPGEVYKLNRVIVEVRWQDLAIIVATSMFICFLATLGPARRGANLPPVEGLRYE